jgi:membrane-associated HD superfamily phosphohydrolase
MIGGFVGGAFSEGLGVLGIFESVVALLIYMINWVFIPKKAAEDGNKTRIAALLGLYTVSLLVGTAYIVWQYTVFPALFPPESWLTITLTTFALNIPIVLIACPALIKAISPKMRIWGLYVGNFAEWRSSRAKPKPA